MGPSASSRLKSRIAAQKIFEIFANFGGKLNRRMNRMKNIDERFNFFIAKQYLINRGSLGLVVLLEDS